MKKQKYPNRQFKGPAKVGTFMSEHLPVRPESAGWVSVEEQLPKESGKYRVIIQRGSAKVTTEETETLFFKKVHRSYWGIGGDWDVVTHWKPNV